MFFSFFLAKNWELYSEEPLDHFVERFYDLLEENYEILPEGIRRMMPYMIADNWILNYAKMDGISRVLNGINRRTKNISKMNFAIVDLEEHYDKFESEFLAFFEELVIFSRQKFNSL